MSTTTERSTQNRNKRASERETGSMKKKMGKKQLK